VDEKRGSMLSPSMNRGLVGWIGMLFVQVKDGWLVGWLDFVLVGRLTSGWISSFVCTGVVCICSGGAQTGQPAKDNRRQGEILMIGWSTCRIGDERTGCGNL
jgi:hypothetical protein